MDNQPERDFISQKGFLTLGSRLKRIGERLQGDVYKLARAEGCDVPVGLLPALGCLGQHGPLSIGELALALGIAQPGVTRNVVQLEKLGLVQSQKGKQDLRQRQVSLTDAGTELVRQTKEDLWPRVERAVAEICGPLEGPILAQLAAIEAALDLKPLDRRAAKS